MLTTPIQRMVAGLAFMAFGMFAVPATACAGEATVSPQAAFAAARALQEAGRTEEAVAAYRRFIARFPDHPEAYNNLAVLLVAQGDMAGARRVLLDGMRTSDSYAAIYDNLNAITLEQARESYIKALRLGTRPRPPQLATLDSITLPPAASEAPPTAIAAVEEPPAAAPPRDAGTAADAHIPDLTRVVADPLAARREEITNALAAWAAAWSARDAELYLSFYSSAFRPPGGMTRRDWAQQRRQRLARPRWIEVSLEDIKVEVADAFHAVVRVRQHYRADNYQDVTLKRLTLKREDDGWRIAREQSLRTLR